MLIPFYLELIGPEGYGFIGFYTTLIGSLAILDLGISSTLNREMARLNANGTPANNIRNLVFSSECIYWGVGCLLGLVVLLLAPILSDNWITAVGLSNQEIQSSIMLMGGLIAVQWPLSMYTGALMGIHKHVSFNVTMVLIGTLRGIGVLFVDCPRASRATGAMVG